MRVRLLGPVDVVVDGEPRAVPGARRKAILATLALHGSATVSTDRLLDTVWGGTAPPTALNALQNHISYLRTAIGSKTAILARRPGYALNLGADATDVALAERLVQEAGRAGDPAVAASHLRQALKLWRGTPLAGVPGLPWLERQAARLDHLYDEVSRALAEARLAAGEHAQLMPELEQMAAENPLDEQVHAHLMLALYRSGRQADALAVYQRLRVTLTEGLGIDPGQPLRDLETAILRQDPALEPLRPAASRPAAPHAEVVPAQLPPAVRPFVGRDAELAALDALPGGLAGPADGASAAIAAITGTAGAGKTALAVHWAHRVRRQFPDGQLYVNLRGFSPGGLAVDPGAALHGFLDALAVPAERIPDDLPARTGLYRSLLAGRRVLVVLDNARDSAQVRPLLPGSAVCVALVTSRDQLTGLVATEGARALGLDLLTDAHAHDLLARRLGADRVGREREAAAEIIKRCAGLPLALTIVAARAATRPRLPLTGAAAELRQAGGGLDPFSGGDPAADVRAVFSWSERALSGGAADMFRTLGLHPGTDITEAAAASLAGVPVGQARRQLAELCRVHLLVEQRPGWYSCHDLLHAYATERAHADYGRDIRDAAIGRLVQHYLQTAHAAAALIEPYLAPFDPLPPGPGVTAGQLGSAGEALNWFAAEHSALLAAIQLAADAGASTCAWQLAWTMTSFQLRRGLWHDHARAQEIALRAARRARDRPGEAHALLAQALGYSRSGRFGEAEPLFRRALQVFETVAGHQSSRATIHTGLAWLSERGQRLPEMLGHATRALDLYTAAGNQPLQAMALGDLGYSHALAGNYQQAIACCQRALAAATELGESGWESATWHSLGYIYHQLGDYREAVRCYGRSLDLSRAMTDLFNEADTLHSIGNVNHSAGDAAAARRAWDGALRILDELDHPDGDLVRAKLRAGPDRGQRSSPCGVVVPGRSSLR